MTPGGGKGSAPPTASVWARELNKSCFLKLAFFCSFVSIGMVHLGTGVYIYTYT